MGRSRFRIARLTFVVAFALGGCGTPSHTVAETQASPKASPPVPKVLEPLPRVSDEDKRVTVTKNGVESSMGTGIAADLTDIGLPIYPTMKLADTYVIKHVDKKSFGMTIQGTIASRAADVDSWYARALGPSFKSGRMHLLGGEIGTFSRKRPGDIESVLVQAERDAQSGREAATLTLSVTKRR